MFRESEKTDLVFVAESSRHVTSLVTYFSFDPFMTARLNGKLEIRGARWSHSGNFL